MNDAVAGLWVILPRIVASAHRTRNYIFEPIHITCIHIYICITCQSLFHDAITRFYYMNSCVSSNIKTTTLKSSQLFTLAGEEALPRVSSVTPKGETRLQPDQKDQERARARHVSRKKIAEI